MKKNKLISALISLSGITSIVIPATFLSSCSSTKTEENKSIPQDKLIIDGQILKGVDNTLDLSAYDTLVVPNGISKIASNAFKNVFTAAHYTNGVNNNVKTIVLPHGLRYIESNAFNGCTGIEKLDLSNLDNDEINFLIFPSDNNGGNDALKELKTKGTIVYNSSLNEQKKKELNDKLLLNGLSKYWIEDSTDFNESESHIVSINDFHGAAPGFEDDFFSTNKLNGGAIRIAQETQEIISKYPGSTFLSCGDYNGGESFSTCKKADTLYPVIKAMNIQYSAVGNHAWEWGKEKLESEYYDLMARTEDTQGKYFVSANILDGSELRSYDWCFNEELPKFEEDFNIWNHQRIKWADPYKILDMNGHNICLIGLTTVDTITDSNLNATKDLTFMGKYDAAIHYTKHLAKLELKDDYSKIESFILLTHCGSNPWDNDPHEIDPSSEMGLLAQSSTTDFDAILSAHTHRVCAGTLRNFYSGKDIWIGQAGRCGRNYMDTKLVFDDNKPVGQRLKSISMEVKTPNIVGNTGQTIDKEKGRQQVKEIVEKTIYPIVRNTAKAYEENKTIAKNELDTPIGTLSKAGLPYYYTEHTEKAFGHEYMQSPTLLEPASVFAAASMVIEGKKQLEKFEEQGKYFAPVAAFNNLDSYKCGYKLEAGQQSRKVIKNEFFAQNATEDTIFYGCLTPCQLKQYINYILEGAGHFKFTPKIAYPIQLYYDNESLYPIQYDEESEKDVYDETTGELVAGSSYSPGPVQFYGLSMNLIVKETRVVEDESIPVYQLADDPDIKVYDGQYLADPTKWTPLETYIQKTGGYVPILFASFTLEGGNAQNRMVRKWLDYNNLVESGSELYDKIKYRQLSMLVRDAIMQYAQDLAEEGKSMDDNISYDLIRSMLNGLQ